MGYKGLWHEDALEDILALDTAKRKAIVDKVKNYLVCDPLRVGKPLAGEFKGLYRLRFDDYRIIYAVDRERGEALIGRVQHRKDVYR